MIQYIFKDANGEKYELRLTFDKIFDVAEATGYDLLNPNQEINGKALSIVLMANPGELVKVVAALCGRTSADEIKAFAARIDAPSFKEMEKAFFDAYSDFFDQLGRGYMATALREDLKTRNTKWEKADEIIQNLPPTTSLPSSPSPESPIGEPEPSGNSTD